MDINDYFDTVNKKVSEMSDEEFEQLLIDSILKEEDEFTKDEIELHEEPIFTMFQPRGDELQILSDIKEYIPTDREDIWSWICYLENELKKRKKREFYNNLVCSE